MIEPQSAAELENGRPIHRCEACARPVDLEHEWARLRLVGWVGGRRAGGRLEAVELRDCECGARLAERVEIVGNGDRHQVVISVLGTSRYRLAVASVVDAERLRQAQDLDRCYAEAAAMEAAQGLQLAEDHLGHDDPTIHPDCPVCSPEAESELDQFDHARKL